MVFSIRGRPRYAALSGCTNATMLSKDIKPGQKMYLRNPDFFGNDHCFSAWTKKFIHVFIRCAVYLAYQVGLLTSNASLNPLPSILKANTSNIMANPGIIASIGLCVMMKL